MDTSSARSHVGVCIALWALCFAGATLPAVAADLDAVEHKITNQTYDNDLKPRVARQFTVLRGSLKGVATAQHAAVLRKVLKSTRWGTIERATMCYVCAWNNVDYLGCRNYLLNATFWMERGFGGQGKLEPETWAEGTIILLYQLYERNHDFRLLHDIITNYSDGAGAATIEGILSESLEKHPRGLLHAAGMSSRVHKRLVNMLVRGEFEVSDQAISVFRIYAKRVASDSSDPLCKMASSLLNDAAKAAGSGKAR